ncbi:hypothetical protein ACFLS9_05605 [Bacteroidota bacterium]
MHYIGSISPGSGINVIIDERMQPKVPNKEGKIGSLSLLRSTGYTKDNLWFDATCKTNSSERSEVKIEGSALMGDSLDFTQPGYNPNSSIEAAVSGWHYSLNEW